MPRESILSTRHPITERTRSQDETNNSTDTMKQKRIVRFLTIRGPASGVVRTASSIGTTAADPSQRTGGSSKRPFISAGSAEWVMTLDPPHANDKLEYGRMIPIAFTPKSHWPLRIAMMPNTRFEEKGAHP